jgi:hypothetical protein
MDDTSADDMPLVAEARRRQTQVLAELMEVRAADIAQFDTFEVGPDAFVGIQVRRIAGQLLQTQPLGTAPREKLSDGPTAMNRRAVPDHQQLARHMPQQVAEKLHDIGTAVRVVLDVQQQAAARGDATDHREVLVGDWKAQRWRVSARRQAAHGRRQQGEARFIYPDDGAALSGCPLFRAGQRSDRHCSIAASLRWLARRSGFCGLQPAARNRLPT